VYDKEDYDNAKLDWDLAVGYVECRGTQSIKEAIMCIV
jgi:hypothetical protein